MREEYMIWLAYFFSYCFLGWIWETIYVWIAERKPSNRGFLTGPVIPIYGFGAMALLWVVGLVGDSLPGLFLLGFFGASGLELVTGYVMERIFQVKYWDYSHLPLNYKGYICLPIAVGWGVFSTALVKLVQPRVAYVVSLIEPDRLRLVLLVIGILFIADIIYSTLEAIDLRELLAKQLTYTKEKLRLEERLAYLGELRTKAMNSLKEAPGKAVDTLKSVPDKASAGIREIEEEMSQLKQELARISGSWQKSVGKKLRTGLRALKRNPHTSSKRYSSSLEEIKKFLQGRK